MTQSAPTEKTNSRALLPWCLLPVLLILILIASCDTQPTQDDHTEDPQNQSFSHEQQPGASTEAFLLDDRFTDLVVEVQYMPGYRPVQGALDELESFLSEHLHKTTITILEPVEIPSGGQEAYSADDIRELEKKHREHYSDGGTLSSYNLFVDGEYDESANVLGIAYYNTSNAYFGETIASASGSPPLSPTREKIEAIVLRHEYGHLIGLVNNGADMQTHHQENGKHCSVEECLMYASVNTADFFANLFDGSIPDLDDFCLADIHAVQQN